ncbi:LLM class flavin-dependent oxidoreductase [Actinoplanes sp. TRM 88003]|uniref:LLM class flavin-dependent oxidoreductase n=1 Tax=Paractinoplanes aksuensis TaxID=2939490 RepID=A0ABT1E3T6_9ACTN|nr:LLM class flavin-dependent oxidoreductase [Actinoplanes aksuensis]MCO8277803.1 LLM class flavin-dependent oxidoreductase [Actinoplanes aksuensis]
MDTGRYRIDPADVNPKSARPIPVYLAGSNRTAFRRIARRADGWLPTGISAAETLAGLAQIRRMAEEEGRDPAQIRCVYQVSLYALLAEVAEGDRKPFTGSARQLAADIAELAEGGVDHVYATLPYVVRDRNEYYDRLAELHAAVRATTE